MTMKKRWIILLAVPVTLIIALSFTGVRKDLSALAKNLEVFAAVYQRINTSYVEEVDPASLIDKGISAMLDELDPYTEYIPESEIEDFRLKYISTQYAGIGARFFVRDDRATLAEVYEGNPAQLAGLRPGDELMAINRESVKGKSSAEVAHLLKGQLGTQVVLDIKSSNREKADTKTIRRSTITQPNVTASGLMPGSVAYVKLDKFLENAASELAGVIDGLGREGRLKGLVLDLRDNGGGILQESVKVVNLFVEPGQAVVSQKGKMSYSLRRYRTKDPAVFSKLPLVVLINEQSASASEIVAGALQDLDRAVIIGAPSFGKGLVQQTFKLPYSNMVKVTVAKYFTPSGRCIQAYDYHDRDASGIARRIEDSLHSEYFTRGGRRVYDGNGIYPDLLMQDEKRSALARSLEKQLFIFDFATEYSNRYQQITDPENFRLSDEDFRWFSRYLVLKGFRFESKTEKLLRELESEYASANLSDSLRQALRILHQSVSNEVSIAFAGHESEIRAMLEQEIVGRYYYQRGQQLYQQRTDRSLKRAVGLLGGEPGTFADILIGKGNYGSIGKPKDPWTEHPLLHADQ